MIMADVFMWTFIIIGLVIVFNCYWLMAHALFPQVVEASRQRYAKHPYKIILTALGVGVPVLIVGVLMMSQAQPLIKVSGIGIVLGMVLVGLTGSAGAAKLIGEGLASPTDEATPWRKIPRGGFVLAASFTFPFLGWFVVMPFVLGTGFGAAVSSMRALRKEAKAKANASEVTEPAREVAA